MKIDLNYVFKSPEGKKEYERIPKTDEDENQLFNEFGVAQFKNGAVFRLKKICQDTLFNPPSTTNPRTGQPEQMDGDKKLKCYTLLQKLLPANGMTDLNVDEIKLLKDLIKARYNSPWTVGQAHDILDPTAKEEEKKP